MPPWLPPSAPPVAGSRQTTGGSARKEPGHRTWPPSRHRRLTGRPTCCSVASHGSTPGPECTRAVDRRRRRALRRTPTSPPRPMSSSRRGRQETASAALLQVPREPPERVEREQRWLRWRGVAREARARDGGARGTQSHGTRRRRERERRRDAGASVGAARA